MGALRSQMFQSTDHTDQLPESDATTEDHLDWAGSDRIRCDQVLAWRISILLFELIGVYPTALQEFQQ